MTLSPGDDGASARSPVGAGFTLDVPETVNMRLGSPAPFTVSVARSGGYAGTISLRLIGLDERVRVLGTPIIPAGATEATLAFLSDLPPSSMRFTVEASAPGISRRSAEVVFSLLPQPSADYGFTLTGPSSVSIEPGGGAMFTVSIARQGGWRGGIELQILGVDGQIRVSMPQRIAENATTATVVFNASFNLSVRNSTFAIHAHGDGVSHKSLSVPLIVHTGGKVYSQMHFWHFDAKQTATVTVNGLALGPFVSYHQASGPIYPGGMSCKSQEPSRLITSTGFDGRHYGVMAAFQTLPGVRYNYTVTWSDGATRSGSFTGLNAGYCGTARVGP